MGPAENIRRFERKDLIAYKNKHYCAENVVVAAAGKYDEAKLLDALERGS